MSGVTAGEDSESLVARSVDNAAETRLAEPEMPLPEDARTVFLGGLLLLAVLAALYVASEIMLPIVLAFVLKLLLQPIVRLGERAHLPRVIGALIAVILVIGVLAGLGMLLTGPAAHWAQHLPEAVPKITDRLRFLSRPIAAVEGALGQIQGGAEQTTPAAAAPVVHLPNLIDTLFRGTRAVAAGFFTMLLVLFYLLMSGETFLRRMVEILPRFKDKRRAVEISLHIEEDISAYLLTITAINLLVGAATFGVMWACGVGDPLLWGATAFLLNYIPILGPMVATVLFAFVGILALGASWSGLLPAVLYFAIHIIEGEAATPMLLARRFTVNPVAVVLGLVFWYWMWGVPGAVLAVPVLAIMKIVCDDVPSLRAFGHFLEG
jgi:predicted PurR-regulated permease PerM